MTTIRTFISFSPPEPIRQEMVTLQSKLKASDADVKWESTDKFHATITFLGDVNEDILPVILDNISKITEKHQTFDVIYEKLGVFPNKHHPKVIWIGCTLETDTLPLLKYDLDSMLSRFGIELEKRPFRPHVTLGRIKSEKNLAYLTPMLEKLTFEPRKARIDGIHVMKSVLHPQGAAYSILTTNHLQPS